MVWRDAYARHYATALQSHRQAHPAQPPGVMPQALGEMANVGYAGQDPVLARPPVEVLADNFGWAGEVAIRPQSVPWEATGWRGFGHAAARNAARGAAAAILQEALYAAQSVPRISYPNPYRK